MKRTRGLVASAAASICLLSPAIASGCSGQPLRDHLPGERLCLGEGLRIYDKERDPATGEREWVLETRLEAGVWTVLRLERDDKYTLRQGETTVHDAPAAAVDEWSVPLYRPCSATELETHVTSDGSALGGAGR